MCGQSLQENDSHPSLLWDTGFSATRPLPKSMATVDQRELQEIHQIAVALSSTERRSVFYLCGSAGADDSVACVKTVLQSKVTGHEAGRLFLTELLIHLRRFDILRRLYSVSRNEVEGRLRRQQDVPRFRVLMTHISEDIGHEDLDSLKFLLSSTIPRETVENIKNFLDIIIELEKKDLVSPERLDFVEKCLKNIGRNDLAKKVSVYQMSVATSEQHSPHQQQRFNAPCPPATSSSFYSLLQAGRGQFCHTGNRPVPVHIQQNPLDLYKFNSNPRGVCLIIDCVGNDGDMLEETFKALHFNVTLYKWLSVEDSLSALKGILKQRENLKGSDGFVCCIISRGTSNHLLGTDLHSTRLHLDSVRRLFTAEMCPMMAGKPKLFFIQRYNVPEFQPCARMHHRDEDLETDGCDGLPKYDYIPTDADVFWSHCWTDEGQLEQGHHRSVYLRALTDTLFKGQRRKTRLLDIHTEMNAIIYDHNRKNPTATYHIDLKHTLRKDLYVQ